MDDRELDHRLNFLEASSIRIRRLLEDPSLTEEQIRIDNQLFGELEEELEENDEGEDDSNDGRKTTTVKPKKFRD